MKPVFANITPRQISCAARPFEANPLSWPKIVMAFLLDGKPHEFRPMHVDDVDAVQSLFLCHYPQLYRSSRQPLFERSFYLEEVALLPDWEPAAVEKPGFVAVAVPKGSHEPIFATLYLKDPYDPVIQLCAAILAPDHRGKDVAQRYVEYSNLLLEQSRAEYAFGTPHVKDTLIQQIALGTGCKVGGIMPGAFRWACGEESYYRDAVVYMYKFLHGSERYSTQPQDWQLVDRVFTDINNLLEQASDRR